MSTLYSGGLDTTSDLPVVNPGDTITSAMQNTISGAIIAIEAALGVSPTATVNEFRLSLVSGNSNPRVDTNGVSTLYLTPLINDGTITTAAGRIGLYDGTNWQLISSAQPTGLTLSGMTANRPHDIFVHLSSGAIVMDTPVAWSSATARATQLAQLNGVLVKNGDATRRYVGTIFAESSSTTSDTAAKRLVANYQNRVPRALVSTPASGGPVTTANTFTIITSGTLSYIAVTPDAVNFAAMSNLSDNTGSLTIDFAIYKDGVGPANYARFGTASDDVNLRRNLSTFFAEQATPGYHYMDLYVRMNSASNLYWNETIFTGTVFQ